jgi:hypothetical protein
MVYGARHATIARDDPTRGRTHGLSGFFAMLSSRDSANQVFLLAFAFGADGKSVEQA